MSEWASRRGQPDPVNPQEIRYSFGGQKAHTAHRLSLDRAQHALAMGIAPEVVRQETGWFQGIEGGWRFEITDQLAALKADDSVVWEAARHKKGGVPLEDLFEHAELFNAYPDLRNLRVVVKDQQFSRTQADANLSTGTISITVITPTAEGLEQGAQVEILSGLLHELQHFIQRSEGFAEGMMPDSVGQVMDQAAFNALVEEHDTLLESEEAQSLHRRHAELKRLWKGRHDIPPSVMEELQAIKTAPIAKTLATLQRRANRKLEDKRFGGTPYSEEELHSGYRCLSGEVEARNVQTRLKMTAEERRQIPPEMTEDVDRNLQLPADRQGHLMPKHQLATSHPSVEAIGSREARLSETEAHLDKLQAWKPKHEGSEEDKSRVTKGSSSAMPVPQPKASFPSM